MVIASPDCVGLAMNVYVIVFVILVRILFSTCLKYNVIARSVAAE